MISCLQLTEVGQKGQLRISYEVEECEGSRGIVCIKAITVSFKRDGNSEILTVYNDASLDFNGSPVTAVSTVSSADELDMYLNLI